MLQDAPLSHRTRKAAEDDEDVDAKDDAVRLPSLAVADTEVLLVSSDDSNKTSHKKTKKSKKKPVNPGAGKILFLDGLRGLAAILVICQHNGFLGLPVGQPAVDMFFVLSAFLLTMIFEKKARTLLEQNASKKRWALALADYFVRRFLRVYPLFAIVAVYLTVYPPAQKEKLFYVRHPEEYNVFKVLTFEFRQRYHVFWTLPLEITYYFIIPVFVLAILALKKYWAIPMVPLAYYVAYTGFYWPRGDHMPLKPHLPTFACGSMAAIFYAKADQWIQSRQFVFRWYHKLLVRVVEMIALSLFCSCLFGGLVFDWVFKNPVPSGPGGRFVSSNVSTVILCEMVLPGALSSVLEWSLLRYAGKISFSMYLLHSFVIYADWVRHQSFYNNVFLVWGLTALLSTISYHLVEYPCQCLAGRVGKVIRARDDAERLRAGQALPTVSPTSNPQTV